MKKKPGPKVNKKTGKKITYSFTLSKRANLMLHKLALAENISASRWIEDTIEVEWRLLWKDAPIQ